MNDENKKFIKYLKDLYNLSCGSCTNNRVLYKFFSSTTREKILEYDCQFYKLRVSSTFEKPINLNLIEYVDNPIKVLEIYNGNEFPNLKQFPNLKTLYLGLGFSDKMLCSDLSSIFDVSLEEIRIMIYTDREIPKFTLEMLELYSKITGCKLSIW